MKRCSATPFAADEIESGLRRAIQRHIQDKVSDILINQHGGEAIERIEVDLEGGELTFQAGAQEIVIPSR